MACHNDKLASGEVSFSAYLTTNSSTALKDRERWELVAQKLVAGEMPPKGVPRPAADQIAAVTHWVETSYARIDRETPPDPGRVTAHRLNRYEYKNSVRDLLGLDLRVADDFPVDPYGYGFDNIGDVLSLSPVLTEKYLKAAEHIANVAIPSATVMKPFMTRYLSERIGQDRELHVSVWHEFPVDGEYTLRSAWFQGLKAGAQVNGRIYLDGKELKSFPMVIYPEMDRGFELHGVPITAGTHKVEADMSYTTHFVDAPYLEYIQIYGPSKQAAATQSNAYKRVFTCPEHTTACAHRIIEQLASRAYRRPVTPAELEGLVSRHAAPRRAANRSRAASGWRSRRF